MATLSLSIPSPLARRESEDAATAAVIREIMTGEELRRKMGEKKREQEAAREACEMKGHRSIAGLGKCVAAIPMMEYFALSAKYGPEELNSREFLQYFNKKFPHLSPNRA